MRDYDPTTGRYIQGDPLGLVDGASVYGYALQNPGRWTDPRGEQATSGLGMGGGISSGIGAATGALAEDLGDAVDWLLQTGRYNANPVAALAEAIVNACVDREDGCYAEFERNNEDCGKVYEGCKMLADSGAVNIRQCKRQAVACYKLAFDKYQICRGY